MASSVFHALIIHLFWWRSYLKTASAAQLLKINQLWRLGPFSFFEAWKAYFRGTVGFAKKTLATQLFFVYWEGTFLPCKVHSTLLLIGTPINGVITLPCTWGRVITPSHPSIFGAKNVSPICSDCTGAQRWESTTVATQNRHPKCEMCTVLF